MNYRFIINNNQLNIICPMKRIVVKIKVKRVSGWCELISDIFMNPPWRIITMSNTDNRYEDERIIFLI